MADLKHKLKKYKAYLQAHPNGDKVRIALDLRYIIVCVVLLYICVFDCRNGHPTKSHRAVQIQRTAVSEQAACTEHSLSTGYFVDSA